MKSNVIIAWMIGRWERVLFYGSLVFLIFLITSFQKDLSRFAQMVDEDTRFLRRVGPGPVLIDEAWLDLLMRRAQDPSAFVHGPARDIFSVVKDESPMPAPSQAPTTPIVFSKGRFSLLKIFRQPVRLLFKGYLQLPDGSYSLQINWAGQTDFKQLGESIRGYRIEKFEKVIDTEVIQGGYTKEVDHSYVIIRKDPNGPVTLAKGNLVSERELFAKLFDAQTNQVATVHVGSEAGSHKVLDITEDEILLSDPSNQEIRLKRTK